MNKETNGAHPVAHTEAIDLIGAHIRKLNKLTTTIEAGRVHIATATKLHHAIHVLQQPDQSARIAELEWELRNILEADPRKWDEMAEPASNFEFWAKSRARWALHGLTGKPAEPAPGLTDDQRVKNLMAAIEGECDGIAISEPHARAILEYVDGRAHEAKRG